LFNKLRGLFGSSSANGVEKQRGVQARENSSDYDPRPLPAQIADRSCWPTEDDRFVEFATAALAYYGVTMDPTVVGSLREIYEQLIDRTQSQQRMEMYSALRHSFERGHIRCNAYLPVLLSETDTGIASTAALDFCLFFNLKKDDPLAGAKEVIKFIVDGAAQNRAALFGGLFALGDERVHKLIWNVRQCLDPKELSAIAVCTTGHPNVACVEFLVQWLETLRGDRNDPYFGQVASGLVMLVRKMRVPFFLTGLRHLGAGPDVGKLRPTDSERKLNLSDGANAFANRLYALEAKEEPPRVMSYVIREFGLVPKFAIQKPEM